MSYMGKVIHIFDGKDTGAEFMIISEPFTVNKIGDTGVKVKCIKVPISSGWYRLGLERVMSFDEIYENGIIK